MAGNGASRNETRKEENSLILNLLLLYCIRHRVD
jgi:hypothetical protein